MCVGDAKHTCGVNTVVTNLCKHVMMMLTQYFHVKRLGLPQQSVRDGYEKDTSNIFWNLLKVQK